MKYSTLKRRLKMQNQQGEGQVGENSLCNALEAASSRKNKRTMVDRKRMRNRMGAAAADTQAEAQGMWGPELRGKSGEAMGTGEASRKHMWSEKMGVTARGPEALSLRRRNPYF